jgi:hypothetical protein
MTNLFTTDTLTLKRNQQKTVYQDTYDDCSFAFEFVPMDADKRFNKQAMLEAYIEVEGFKDVDAVGYLDVSYSKIDRFNRLFYFLSDDADPSIHNMSSLENIQYGILGDNGINPFNVSDQEFAFSDSKIKAGYANNAPVYADNTHLRHDYIRYTAKAITGGYALSDVFSNERELIEAVEELDLPFNLDFAKKINDLSGCIQEGSEHEGWKSCKSLVTGLFDLSNETNTNTTRFKRGTQFLRDLAEQSINTFESEKNVSQGEFWVKFHPGDAIAVRLTYNPENGNNQPAKNSLGFLGENKLNDRSYKIYLRFKKANLDEATQGILSEFTNMVTYKSDADKAIGQKTALMPTLLSDSLKTMTFAKSAIAKSFEKADDLKDHPPTPIVLGVQDGYESAMNASSVIDLAEGQLKVALGSIGDIKVEIETASSQLNNTSSYTTTVEFPSVYAKSDSLKGIMTNVADSVKNIAEIVVAKNAVNVVSTDIPKTYEVLERTKIYAENRVNDFKPKLDSYFTNMTSMISTLNTSASTELTNVSSRMNQNMAAITNEKRNVYKEFVFASVAQNASSCRSHARLANEHSTVVEKLNDDIFNDFNKTESTVSNVSILSGRLSSLSNVLANLNASVVVEPGYDEVSDPPKTIVASLNSNVILARSKLITSNVLNNFSNKARLRNLDSKLKNMQSIYHAANTKKVADLWVTNEEVAKSEAAKVVAMTAARNAVLTDALATKQTATATKATADAAAADAASKLSASNAASTAAATAYTNAVADTASKKALFNTAVQTRNNKQSSFNSAASAKDEAVAAVLLATSQSSSKDAALNEALEVFNKYKSDAAVLRSTANTLLELAANGTTYEVETANAANLEAEAAEAAAEAKRVLYDQAVTDAGDSNEDLESKKAAEASAISGYNTAAAELAIAESQYVKKLEDATAAGVADAAALDAKNAAVAAAAAALETKNAADTAKYVATASKSSADSAYTKALNDYNKEDSIDEVNADLAALVAASKDSSVVGSANANLSVAAQKCVVTFDFNLMNHMFDIICELTDEFKGLTLGVSPGGVFYLRNLTDNESLGNNTNDENDDAQQYIGGSTSTHLFKINGNNLEFVNRMPAMGGAKLLQVFFYDAISNKHIPGKAFTLYADVGFEESSISVSIASAVASAAAASASYLSASSNASAATAHSRSAHAAYADIVQLSLNHPTNSMIETIASSALVHVTEIDAFAVSANQASDAALLAYQNAATAVNLAEDASSVSDANTAADDASAAATEAALCASDASGFNQLALDSLLLVQEALADAVNAALPDKP